MQITNKSNRLQGVWTDKGRVYIQPGETRDVELSETGAKLAKRLNFLDIKGAAKAKAVKPVKAKTKTKTEKTDAEKAGELLAMAGDETVDDAAFVAAAKALIGEGAPDGKAELVAALEEIATAPQE